MEDKGQVCCTDDNFWSNIQLFTQSELFKRDEKNRAKCRKLIQDNLEDEKNAYPGLKQKLEKRRFIAICQWLHLDAEDKQVVLF